MYLVCDSTRANLILPVCNVCAFLIFFLPEVSLRAILLDHVHTPIVKSPHMKEGKNQVMIFSMQCAII